MEESMEKREETGQTRPEVKGPLKGIRVLDLGHVGAGPVGPTLLAEWGAEVIKVEAPEGGNMMRKLPPLHQGQSFMYLIQGRNKKSIAVDIHTEMGQEAIRRLVRESDVVLENYRPGTLERWNLGILRERIGNRVDYLAPVGLYETRDGRWIAILGAPDEKDFGRMIRAMGREDLAQNPRFNSIVQRAENHHALNELVANWVRGYDLKEVAEILTHHEVPMSPVFSIQDFFEDPHYQARGNILEVADPAMGSVKMQDVVPKLSLTPGKVVSAGPLLGQHNQEIYGDLLGLSEEEIGRLKEEGIL